VELKPFDPADYLHDEEQFAIYLEDAALDGPEAVAEAEIVIARARARLKQPDGRPAVRSASAR
jgi:DNA-binding phage protein